MKEPVDHILRPRLPWRRSTDLDITECGYDASKVKALTRDEYAARLKEFGKQRTAMITCMTCAQTSERWASWQDDPRKAVGREIEWEAGWRRGDRGQRLKDELLAIEQLIAAHSEEFSKLVDDIVARRDWLLKKAAASSQGNAVRGE